MIRVYNHTCACTLIKSIFMCGFYIKHDIFHPKEL